MARSTYGVYLMKGTGSAGSLTWAKLVDIKDFPDLGGTPEMLDATTLSDAMTKNIMGIQSLDALEFTANYDKTDYDTLKALKGKTGDFAVWFGHSTPGTPDGHDGKYKFQGEPSVFITGGGVNEVVSMAISFAASTEITEDTAE